MYSGYGGSPTVTNCTFSGNISLDDGGGMYNRGGSTVTNCTFSGNTADDGGALWNQFNSSQTVTNCIFWGDSPNEISNSGSTLFVEFSDVQGPWPGNGTINADPLFVRPPDPGADGEWGTEDDDYGDLRLLADSPCLDTANTAALPPDTPDLDGDGDTDEPIPHDLDGDLRVCSEVDMGAYEFGLGVGDGDCDQDVDLDDFDAFFECVTGFDGGILDGCGPFDFDYDADVDLLDYAGFQAALTD